MIPDETFSEPVTNTLPLISSAACGAVLFNPTLPLPLSNKLLVPSTVELLNFVI